MISYASAGLQLKGYLLLPKRDALRTESGYPVLLYLHGGFALGADEVKECAPFTDAGFAVFAPAFRGENGNPGFFEYAYGELDDARAALGAIAGLKGLDASRVVVFGHSSGGMLSALMALYPQLPAIDTGSAGGFYTEELFSQMPVPFENTEAERRLRLTYYHAAELRQPHFACAGSRDTWPLSVARGAAQAAGAELTVTAVSGDHLSSAPGCISAYLQRVMKKLPGVGAALPPGHASTTSLAGTEAARVAASLVGEWQTIEATSNGEPPPPGMLATLTLVFTSDTISIAGAPPTRYTLDATTTPRQVDIQNSLRQVGILDLSGDTLKLCFGMHGDRPRAFRTKQGSNQTYLLLKRVARGGK